MRQLSQSKRKDIGHELEVARVTKRMKTMDYDDNKLLEDAQKLLADIQSKNLSTKDMQAELENNKFGTSQALAEGHNEVISNEQKSIDELAQASKHGKDK
nr:hypothetical protein [Tanacetum cinerariifolium]GFA38341.1 hypothetical protein [Tanacetum cinerariifolium]